jgi:hypothetical protein
MGMEKAEAVVVPSRGVVVRVRSHWRGEGILWFSFLFFFSFFLFFFFFLFWREGERVRADGCRHPSPVFAGPV